MTVSEQREMLAAWLAEWRLEKDLPPPPQEDEASSGDGRTEFGQSDSDKTVAATGAVLRAGDIVLLPPDGEMSSARPVYVTLLDARPNGSWLCAPFSRFSTPATEGEYATGRNFDPLKVICAWNAHDLPQNVLARGWLVEHLGAPDVKILSDFALKRRAELPRARRGSPIVHPLDPRRESIAEERCLWIDFQTTEETAPQEWEVREPPIGYAAEDSPDPTP
jgi:hypothetical protein